VIERGTKALIGITDNWTQWQNLTGVQTNWPDGTVLIDYSGANSNPTTVYGGGKGVRLGPDYPFGIYMHKNKGRTKSVHTGSWDLPVQ
jgi:hypothetical protein